MMTGRRLEDAQKEECLLNRDHLCRIRLENHLSIISDQQESYNRPYAEQEFVNQRKLLILNIYNILKQDESGKWKTIELTILQNNSYESLIEEAIT